MQLQSVAALRPMTHDLLKNVVTAMGGKVSHIIVNALQNDTFYAQIILDIDGRSMEIDSRPSDALALAVRTNAKIFVEEEVMKDASIVPEVGLDLEAGFEEAGEELEDENLEAFRDFVDSLDLDDFSSGTQGTQSQ
jgi:bifunctional DNase/RNase